MKSGTKWRLALATFGGPFVVATVALFAPGSEANLASFAEWSDFIRWQTPIILGLYAVADVAHKSVLAKLSQPKAPDAE